MKERVRRCVKFIYLKKHQFLILFNRKKIKKTSNESENGAFLSQIGRRCPPLIQRVPLSTCICVCNFLPVIPNELLRIFKKCVRFALDDATMKTHLARSHLLGDIYKFFDSMPEKVTNLIFLITFCLSLTTLTYETY